LDTQRLFHEPPDAERHVRVVWEDGGSDPASYPIRIAKNERSACLRTPTLQFLQQSLHN
jgi:hypothetical protein